MAQAVVDLFEAIQVEVHHRQRRALVACSPGQFPLQPVRTGSDDLEDL
jgi:hypothetical protein